MSTESERSPGGSWVPSTDELGVRLAMVRQHEGWNAKEAALACGVAPQSWRDWESGMHPRDMVTICRAISARTGVDLHWLLTGEYGGPQNLKFEQEELELPGFPEAM